MNELTTEEYQILYNLWEMVCLSQTKKVEPQDSRENWEEQVQTLYSLGIGMEETIRFLYHNKPSLEEFESWIYKSKTSIKGTLNVTVNEDVLTPEDLIFWKQNGYVVLRNVISKEQCVATQKAIFEFLEMQENEPSSWYKFHPEKRGLMVTFTNHQTLNANRESYKIQRAYEQLYGTAEIYKTIDKVSFNPPETDQYCFLGSKLHWDVSLNLPIPFGLQGLLYLTDCNDKQGAFHCVPGFHNQIDNWLNHLPDGINPREEALKVLNPIPVYGKAGDFIIWHQALPHCATANLGTFPRLVQYLTYLPKNKEPKKAWS